MPRGGRRPGAGRKAGSKNLQKFQLEAAAPPDGRKPTAAERHQAQRDLVAALVAQDMSREAIAAVLKLTVEHFEAAFAHELEHGHAMTKAKITASILAGVSADSVAAARKLDEMVAMTGASPRAPGLGKKAAAKERAAAAVAAGGIFAPRPPPGVGKKEWATARAPEAAVGTPWENTFGGKSDDKETVQ